MGPAEDDERLALHVPPVRVRPRHVPDQVAHRPLFGIKEQWQVTGDQAAAALRHQRGEAVLPDERVEPGGVVHGEGSGNIHGVTRPLRDIPNLKR